MLPTQPWDDFMTALHLPIHTLYIKVNIHKRHFLHIYFMIYGFWPFEWVSNVNSHPTITLVSFLSGNVLLPRQDCGENNLLSRLISLITSSATFKRFINCLLMTLYKAQITSSCNCKQETAYCEVRNPRQLNNLVYGKGKVLHSRYHKYLWKLYHSHSKHKTWS